MLEMVGTVLLPLTVSTKESVAVSGPSVTLTVVVAGPFWFGAGVTVTVRFEPLPANTILPLGTSTGLEEAALNCRLGAAISASPIRKGIGPTGLPKAVAWSGMSEITGGVLGPQSGYILASRVVASPAASVTVKI